MLELAEKMGGVPGFGEIRTTLDKDVYMGHEFVGEVLETGPDTAGPETGSLVTSIPAMVELTGVEPLVYSNRLPCGYGERMLLSAPLLQAVPNGLSARHAALTEPMAVGLHAVNKSAISSREGALVLGCGPIGIAVIAALKRRGVEPVVAADFSPTRRSLAILMGAHEAVDPATEMPFDAWTRVGRGRAVVVFEAVGVPGMIDEVLRSAPMYGRVVVVGVCMGTDTITPFWAVTKELNLQFSLAYDPLEFNESLNAIAEGDIDVAPLITGEVGVEGVPQAFDELADPERHCKILVVPTPGG